jgi:hypothetical protein
MKRTELKVGQELYLATRRDWESCDWGRKVRVVDTAPWAAPRTFTGWPRPTTGGMGVAVQYVQANGETGPIFVTPLASLKGEYETVKAQVAARVAEKEADRRRLQAAQKDARDHKNALVERAEKLGFDLGFQSPYSPKIELNAQQFEALLDAADWRTR